MENKSFEPTRKNGGINKSLPVYYIWPEKFGISNRNTLAEKSATTRSLVSLDRHDKQSVTSSKGKVCEETVSLTGSKRSQAALNLRKMRLSLETEKVRNIWKNNKNFYNRNSEKSKTKCVLFEWNMIYMKQN
ncbi:hypothetical protein JTB14_033174 [Gonioctena quinquepunctata]|nr:hypothetical protein JTB14_033174 [Gonioctena quinquepunctata]